MSYLKRVGIVAFVTLASAFMAAPTTPICPECHTFYSETNLAVNTQKTYSFSVTSGKRYDIILGPTSGNPNLYSRSVSPVTQSQYDCRPLLSGAAEEVCTITPTSSGTHYIMVNVASGPSSYYLWVVESGNGCHSGSEGGYSYCSETCKCGYDLGDCDSDSECADGLSCVSNVGAEYGWPSDVDVCR